MAHRCPECCQACYCGGDIDDILMDGTEEEMGCTHCPIDGYGDDDVEAYANEEESTPSADDVARDLHPESVRGPDNMTGYTPPAEETDA